MGTCADSIEPIWCSVGHMYHGGVGGLAPMIHMARTPLLANWSAMSLPSMSGCALTFRIMILCVNQVM